MVRSYSIVRRLCRVPLYTDTKLLLIRQQIWDCIELKEFAGKYFRYGRNAVKFKVSIP